MAKKPTGLRERAAELPKWRLTWADRLQRDRPEVLAEIVRIVDEFHDGDKFWRERFKGAQSLVEWACKEHGLDVEAHHILRWYRTHREAKQ